MPTNRLSIAAGFALHDAGQDWDAIRVPQPLGVAAMTILGGRCGAVVEDPHAKVVYYFVPVGAAAQWEVEHTRAISDGGTVAIPPVRCTNGPGPHWRICPGDGGWLTDARALRAALEACLDLGAQPAYRWEDRLKGDEFVGSNVRLRVRPRLTVARWPGNIDIATRVCGHLMDNVVRHAKLFPDRMVAIRLICPSRHGELIIEVDDALPDFPGFDEIVSQGTDGYPPVTGLWWIAHAEGQLAWELLRGDDGEVIGKTVQVVLPPSP
jgi:hypothetical protein